MKKISPTLSAITTLAAMTLAASVAFAVPSFASSAAGTGDTFSAAFGTAPVNRCNVIDVAAPGANPALGGVPVKQLVPFGCM